MNLQIGEGRGGEGRGGEGRGGERGYDFVCGLIKPVKVVFVDI